MGEEMLSDEDLIVLINSCESSLVDLSGLIEFAKKVVRAARAQALEEAAKLVENYDTCGDVGTWQETFAERIRALINKEQAQ